MARHRSIKSISNLRNDSFDRQSTSNEYDEEIDETEDDLIENYLYLTRHCGLLKHSPTSSALESIPTTRRTLNFTNFTRQYSLAIDHVPDSNEYDQKNQLHKSHCSLNDVNNNYQRNSSIASRVPPTIYYNSQGDDDEIGGQFSLVKLFARMKARLKHDRRYRADSTHELLREEESPDWLELTKNTRQILSKALLPDGGYDALTRTPRRKMDREKEKAPVLSIDFDEDEDHSETQPIEFDIDHRFAPEDDEEYDEIIWHNFLSCARGFHYRRVAVCKAIDRQYFQGQLVYVYGVANNILIDENLKASGLG